MNPRRPSPREPESRVKARSRAGGFPSKLGSLVVEHGKLPEFIEWCVEEQNASPETCQKYAKYLLKPFNPQNKWSAAAYKLYAKFTGNQDAYEKIRIPKSSVDFKVPSADEVARSIRIASQTSEALGLVYRILVESGARLTEVCKMLSEFEPENLKEHNGFYTYALGYKRGSKQSYYIFCTTKPRKLEVSDKWVRNWAAKNNVVNPKYLRKFVATTMAALGISESIINFIQGRVPQSILPKHYLSLYALALQEYPKYAEWLRKLVP